MTAYYNEIDPFAAAWLRKLIDAGHIAKGDVDERSIEDVKPDDLRGYPQCHFFAGIGVWSYALRQAGWPDDEPVWTGSCPCQPFSAAGERGGTSDERHLWPAFYHLIRERSPRMVFGEQVASKDGLAWFSTVSADLEAAGYAVGGVDLCAAGFGAPHPRQRIYFVGYSQRERLQGFINDPRLFGTTKASFPQRRDEIVRAWRQLETSPTSLPHLDGTPLWLARKLLHGYGNALCAEVAKGFIESFLDTRLAGAQTIGQSGRGLNREDSALGGKPLPPGLHEEI